MERSCPHCGARMPEIDDGFCSECRNDVEEAPAVKIPDGKAEPVIWYATEARVFAWWKFAWDDDRGRIDPDRDGLRFVGREGILQMARLPSIPRVVWVIPWAAVAALVLGNALVLLMASAGVFNYLTLDNPLSYVVLGLTDLFALAFWPMQWVRVDYSDERGNARRAYFTVGSVGARWTGGAQRLQEQLEQWTGGPIN